MPPIRAALKTGRPEGLIRLADPPLVVRFRPPISRRWQDSRRFIFVCSLCLRATCSAILLCFVPCPVRQPGSAFPISDLTGVLSAPEIVSIILDRHVRSPSTATLGRSAYARDPRCGRVPDAGPPATPSPTTVWCEFPQSRRRYLLPRDDVTRQLPSCWEFPAGPSSSLTCAAVVTTAIASLLSAPILPALRYHRFYGRVYYCGRR